MSVINWTYSKRNTQVSFIYNTLQWKTWSAKTSTPKFGCCRAKWDSYCHAMDCWIRTFLTGREKLDGLAIHLIWSSGTYTELSRFKKNPNVVYATFFSKIPTCLEHLKDRTLRKYNFVNSFNVKDNIIKYYGGPPVYGKCKIFSNILFSMLSIPMMNCGQTFLTPFTCVSGFPSHPIFYPDIKRSRIW